MLEWDAAQLAMLQGSGHAARARRRIALVDGVYREVFPALTDADPSLFGGGGGGGRVGTGTGTMSSDGTDDGVGGGGGGGGGEEEEEDSCVTPSSRQQQQRQARLLRRREKTREMKAARAAKRFTSRDAFRWAFATVLARAFELPDIAVSGGSGGAGEMGLCPGLDLFNHGSEAEKCTVDGLLTHKDHGEGGGGGKGPSVTSGGVKESGLTTEAVKNDEEEEDDEEDEETFSGPPRVTLRAGVGGAEAGEQLFHDYADHASGGSLLEFGFTHFIPPPRRHRRRMTTS